MGSSHRKLPRAPAIFDRKVKWKLGELDPLAQPEWRANYTSADEHRKHVKLQFEEELGRGFMTTMSLRDALAKFGDSLPLTAIGALEKKGDTDEVRIIPLRT